MRFFYCCYRLFLKSPAFKSEPIEPFTVPVVRTFFISRKSVDVASLLLSGHLPNPASLV
ncbi:hypothetical protein [Chryseobacterium sp. G0240]|uniref:hypothetical protein n=1 Tax=Chryseobacterium sp. G0240 TaxID=2487066 RepID=UPI00160C44DF|nr:hypothetical protein [Chryseobacterium sp. G0240]